MLSRKSFGTLAVAVASGLLWAGSAQAVDVLSLGGVRDPLTGQWTGTASLEMVPVGDVGNAADESGYGRVDYAYNIGKYEVTAGQYTAFLNAVAGVDTNALYNTSMWSDIYYGCKIERFSGSGTAVSPYQYRVASDYANRPVNYVCFWDACRFSNWLQNGQNAGAQDNTTTEDGAYTLTSDGISGNTITRNTGWQWAVTSEDEWYKAAYYKAGSTNAGYWLYPTRSNYGPGRDMADANGNNANNTVPYAASPIDNGHYTTVVGEFQNSASPYGTFDQGGNVWEWNDNQFRGSSRGLWGGSFCDFYGDSLMSGDRWYYGYPTYEYYHVGFRISQVPEPTSIGLLGLGVMGMLLRRRSATK